MGIFKITLILCLLASSLAVAGESGRRYDNNNNFIGTYVRGKDGTYRLYDNNNTFEGTVVPDRKDRRKGRQYSWDNSFQGTVGPDPWDE